MRLNYRYYALVDAKGMVWAHESQIGISEDLAVIRRIFTSDVCVTDSARRAWRIISLTLIEMAQVGESSYHLIIPRSGVQ
jgi:hypothetical protein